MKAQTSPSRNTMLAGAWSATMSQVTQDVEAMPASGLRNGILAGQHYDRHRTNFLLSGMPGVGRTRTLHCLRLKPGNPAAPERESVFVGSLGIVLLSCRAEAMARIELHAQQHRIAIHALQLRHRRL